MLVDSPSKNVKSLEEELKVKYDLLRAKDQTIAALKAQLSLSKFGVDRFGTDDSLINLYTGFTNYTALKAFYDYLAPSASSMTSAYTPSENVSYADRPRAMPLMDELFMFLCRLRQNFGEQDLAICFNICQSSVSRNLSHGLISYILCLDSYQFGYHENRLISQCQHLLDRNILQHELLLTVQKYGLLLLHLSW